MAKLTEHHTRLKSVYFLEKESEAMEALPTCTQEGRTVAYSGVSRAYRIWEPGARVVESRNVTFIETIPVNPNTLDHCVNDSDDGIVLDLESAYNL